MDERVDVVGDLVVYRDQTYRVLGVTRGGQLMVKMAYSWEPIKVVDPELVRFLPKKESEP